MLFIFGLHANLLSYSSMLKNLPLCQNIMSLINCVPRTINIGKKSITWLKLIMWYQLRPHLKRFFKRIWALTFSLNFMTFLGVCLNYHVWAFGPKIIFFCNILSNLLVSVKGTFEAYSWVFKSKLPCLVMWNFAKFSKKWHQKNK